MMRVKGAVWGGLYKARDDEPFATYELRCLALSDIPFIFCVELLLIKWGKQGWINFGFN